VRLSFSSEVESETINHHRHTAMTSAADLQSVQEQLQGAAVIAAGDEVESVSSGHNILNPDSRPAPASIMEFLQDPYQYHLSLQFIQDTHVEARPCSANLITFF
jgi:hypothetical protein